ncbi:hypothetical protein [Streptomyces sp. NPDC005209]|uniref:hypothetical protein n=1 Tax=Streptomyces sp. NPDC005209 TaxID=3156715 RepID=UPI00339F3A61
MFLQSLTESVDCADCGAVARWHGVHVLLDDDTLRWDTEVACPECGAAMVVCGRRIPGEVRERMLAAQGRAVLRLGASPVDRGAVLRALRKTLGLGLAEVKGVLEQVLGGEYGGTQPETELLARRLRAAGVDAVADDRLSRPHDAEDTHDTR